MRYCYRCGQSKRAAGGFRYIKYLEAYSRMCLVCAAKARQKKTPRARKRQAAKRRRETERSIQQHGFTPRVVERLQTTAAEKATDAAALEILSNLPRTEVRAYEEAKKIHSGRACFASLSCLALFGLVPLILFGALALLPVALIAVLFPIYAVKKNGEEEKLVSAIDGRIAEQAWPHFKHNFEEEKRKRIQYEGFYGSMEWRTLRQRFIGAQKKVNGAYICHYCGRCIDPNDINVDHKFPRSKYPALGLEIDNLRLACRPCNSSKGDRLVD